MGFASGVMVAAAVWSLLIPAMDQSAHLGRLAFLPAAVGFLLGMAFLLLMDQLVPHLHLGSEKAEGPNSSFKRLTMLVLAVTLHNIPEGMAVGVVFAGMLTGDGGDHPHRGLRPVHRHRHPEFPRGGHHLPPP